jgi:YD repeat-containing protein
MQDKASNTMGELNMKRKTWGLMATIAMCWMILLTPVWEAPAATIQYAYDDAGRLVRADYGGGKRITYGYDANGNSLKRTAIGEIIRGDVNVDGAVNLLDALVTLRLLSGLVPPDQAIADYMAGGKASSEKLGFPDVLWILQNIAELRN